MKSITKTAAFTTVGILIAGAGIVAGLELSNTTHWFHNKPVSSTQASPDASAANPTSQQQTTTNDQQGPSPTSSKSSDQQTPKQYETPAAASSSSSNLSGVINYKSVRNGTLSIRATINQKLSSGTCKLTLTKASSGATVTQTADVLANPSSSTCKGFDVPTSKLSSGKWNIAIGVTSGSRSGRITSSVNI